MDFIGAFSFAHVMLHTELNPECFAELRTEGIAGPCGAATVL